MKTQDRKTREHLKEKEIEITFYEQVKLQKAKHIYFLGVIMYIF